MHSSEVGAMKLMNGLPHWLIADFLICSSSVVILCHHIIECMFKLYINYYSLSIYRTLYSGKRVLNRWQAAAQLGFIFVVAYMQKAVFSMT